MSKKRIICTKKINSKTKNKAALYNLEIIDLDFLSIESTVNNEIATKLRDNKNPLIFTSANAVNAVVKNICTFEINLIQKDCYAIDGKTAQKALEAQFNLIGLAPSGKALANKIIKKRVLSLLHCTTQMRRKELYQITVSNNIIVNALEVYQKKIIAHKIERGYEGLMIFSPSQLDAFLLNNTIAIDLPIFCIGPTTSNYAKQLGYLNVQHPKEASINSTVEQVINFYQ